MAAAYLRDPTITEALADAYRLGFAEGFGTALWYTGCTGKAKQSHADAVSTAARLGKGSSVYPCPVCRCWHATSMSYKDASRHARFKREAIARDEAKATADSEAVAIKWRLAKVRAAKAARAERRQAELEAANDD